MDLALTNASLVLLVLSAFGLFLVISTFTRLFLLTPFCLHLYTFKCDLILTPPHLPLQFNLSFLILLINCMSIHLYMLQEITMYAMSSKSCFEYLYFNCCLVDHDQSSLVVSHL